MAQQHPALCVGHTQFCDLRQPALVKGQQRHRIGVGQRHLLAQGALELQLDLAQGLVNAPDRGRHALVQQQRQILDRGTHLGLLARLRFPQGHREHPHDEQIQSHDRRHQGQENGLFSLLHDEGQTEEAVRVRRAEVVKKRAKTPRTPILPWTAQLPPTAGPQM